MEDHLVAGLEFVQAHTETLRTGAFRDPECPQGVVRHFKRIVRLLMQGAYAGPGAYAASFSAR
jgi:hypothetical protein